MLRAPRSTHPHQQAVAPDTREVEPPCSVLHPPPHLPPSPPRPTCPPLPNRRGCLRRQMDCWWEGGWRPP